MKVIDSQRLFKAAGYYSGPLDGDYGPKTREAVGKLLDNRREDLYNFSGRWSLTRRRIAASQLVLKYAGFAEEVGRVDGLFGPLTLYAFEAWEHQQRTGSLPLPWRSDDFAQEQSEEPVELVENVWPHQSQMTRFYGTPGGPQCTAGIVHLPYAMKIAWNKRQVITSFRCHEKVADSAQRIFEKIESAYSPRQISSLGFDMFGGCFNYRKKRGGKTLSTHAYGVAIDIDPEPNQLRWGRDRARLARPECIEFWRIWESEGWLSLGRARNFDWMHVQAAVL